MVLFLEVPIRNAPRHFHVAKGLDVPCGNVASSVDFDATRMFYGNAFEAFASSVDILAYLNNMRAGRPFDQFERLTQKEYLKLDKGSCFDAFASVPAFAALCEERDNQLRNASHHGGRPTAIPRMDIQADSNSCHRRASSTCW
jgi:hypothetical protein